MCVRVSVSVGWIVAWLVYYCLDNYSRTEISFSEWSIGSNVFVMIFCRPI